MINVSSATKAAWMSDRKVNHIVISFPNLNLTYGNDSIDPDSLSWSEALCNADSMEFVGCIAGNVLFDCSSCFLFCNLVFRRSILFFIGICSFGRVFALSGRDSIGNLSALLLYSDVFLACRYI